MKKLDIGQLIDLKYNGAVSLTGKMLLEMIDDALAEEHEKHARKAITEERKHEEVITIDLDLLQNWPLIEK